MKKPKRCRYCQQMAVLARPGDAAYPYQQDYGPVWVCTPCGAWVGCHPGTENPLGGLANAQLRAAKICAHAAFDPLWQAKMRRDGCSKTRARRAGYKWLAGQLGIDVKVCHIGFMDLDECQRVVEICNAIQSRRTA